MPTKSNPLPLKHQFPPRIPFSPAAFRAVWGRQSLATFLAREARRRGDVLQMRPGVWLVAHPEMARQVLVNNPKSWSKARGAQKTKWLLGEGLLASQGETHRTHRALLQPLFSASRLPLYSEAIVDCSLEAGAKWHDGEEIDLSAQMSALAFEIVRRTVFGAPQGADAQIVTRALDEATQLFDRVMTPLGDWFERLPSTRRRIAHTRRDLDAIVFALLAQKRETQSVGADVLSVLLHARDENGAPWSDEAIRDEAVTLLLAGHETTANALVAAFYLLSCHAQAREMLEREIDGVLGSRRAVFGDLGNLKWTRAVLQEAMRIFPPVWITGRLALRDVEIEGANGSFVVPCGTTVLVSPFILHRDARFWESPRRFDPSRWQGNFTPVRGAYMPFGAGTRVCLAENFAWMEATLVLATLCQSFRAHALTPLRLQPSVTLRPQGKLPFRLENRS